MKLAALLLAVAGTTVCRAQAPKFEVASVKVSAQQSGILLDDCSGDYSTNHPTRLEVRRKTLWQLTLCAYELEEYQLEGGPSWTKSLRYDIDAKAEQPVSRPQKLQLLQQLLRERFDLVFHRDTRPVTLVVLSVDKDGAKFGPQFHLYREGNPPAEFPRTDGPRRYNPMNMKNWAKSVRVIVETSPRRTLVPPVVDQTGLEGVYEITLKISNPDLDFYDWADLFRRQLGLRMEERKLPTEILTIDSCHQANANE